MFWISDLDFVRGETRTRELPDRGDVIVQGVVEFDCLFMRPERLLWRVGRR